MDVTKRFGELWFIHGCTLISGAGESPYGGSVGERIQFKGYVSQSTQRVDGPMGQELVTDTVVRCPLSVPAVIGDQVELPEPFGGRWEVTSISSHDGIGGVHAHHQKLTLTQPGDTQPGDTGTGGIYG